MIYQADDKLISPLVSIIVTSYNQSETISNTLESILMQKCDFPMEIIIGDDCSTDNTQNICTEYQERHPKIILPLLHRENMGVAANFALCVKQAGGKYIAVCAADDFWHNQNKLQLEVDFLEKHPDYGLLYTDYDKLNIVTGKIARDYLKRSNLKIYEGEGLIKAFFNGKVPVLTLTVMFRKELFDKYIPAADYIKYRFPLEDWPTWLILSKYCCVGYLPVSTGTYRFGHESISNQKTYLGVEKRFSKEKIMYKYLCDMFPEDLTYNETSYDIYVIGILLTMAYEKSDYQSARKYAQKLIELGSDRVRVKMAQYWPTFKIFAILRKVRQKMNS